MSMTRALLSGLLLGVLLAVVQGCASSATAGVDDDGGVTDGGAADRARQQDAPPFDPDATVQTDGSVGDATEPQDAIQSDAATCTPEPDEALGGDTCLQAIDKGSLSDLQSNHVTILGNLWPAGDVDWYRISFVDSPDDTGATDKYNVKISFTATGNPGGRYAFDVVKDDCATAPSCGTAGEVNTALTQFDWNDSGEAPCWADPGSTQPGTHICVDHSMVLRIRVFRASGSPVCENYELAFDNGGPI